MTSTEPRRRVLLVEDEAMIAMLIEDMLADLGCEVVHTASRIADALMAAQEQACDLAILDLNLNGAQTYPVAEVLRARGIPIIFATGYGSNGLDPKFAGAPALAKPFQQTDLEIALKSLRDGQGA